MYERTSHDMTPQSTQSSSYAFYSAQGTFFLGADVGMPRYATDSFTESEDEFLPKRERDLCGHE